VASSSVIVTTKFLLLVIFTVFSSSCHALFSFCLLDPTPFLIPGVYFGRPQGFILGYSFYEFLCRASSLFPFFSQEVGFFPVEFTVPAFWMYRRRTCGTRYVTLNQSIKIAANEFQSSMPQNFYKCKILSKNKA